MTTTPDGPLAEEPEAGPTTPEDAVLHVPGCTACDDAYASYRRDRTSERMLHYIQMPGALA